MIPVAILLAAAAAPSQTTRPTAPLRILSVQCGSGPIWPYRIRALDARGRPTDRLLEVTGESVLRVHRTDRNPVLPPADLAAGPVLPDGSPGNQFLWFRFNLPVDADRLLRSGGISVLAYDPETETTSPVTGRWFAGGLTVDPGEPGAPRVVVASRGDGVAVVAPEGDGFPAGFPGDGLLVRPESVVFVPDTDRDLRTAEAFPHGLIRIVVTDAVQSTEGAPNRTEIATHTFRPSR